MFVVWGRAYSRIVSLFLSHTRRVLYRQDEPKTLEVCDSQSTTKLISGAQRIGTVE